MMGWRWNILVLLLVFPVACSGEDPAAYSRTTNSAYFVSVGDIYHNFGSASPNDPYHDDLRG